MSIRHARVVRAGEASVTKVAAALPTRPEPLRKARVVRREILQAQEHASQILADAEARAGSIVARAREDAAAIAEELDQQARARAQAELAEAWVAMRAREARIDRDTNDRILAIARLLAERLLRTQLSQSPENLLPMAREAIAQFWSASQVTVRGCKQDLEVLTAHVEELGIAPASLRLIEDDQREIGSLLVQTNIGALDTDISLQLDRLVEALRRSSG